MIDFRAFVFKYNFISTQMQPRLHVSLTQFDRFLATLVVCGLCRNLVLISLLSDLGPLGSFAFALIVFGRTLV